MRAVWLLLGSLVLLGSNAAAADNSAALSSSYAPPAPSPLPSWQGFIRVQNKNFVDANCQAFPVTGFNTWELMEAAAGILELGCWNNSKDAVNYTFAAAAANGMTVVRAFAHGVDADLILQPKAGVYNETAFVALDYVLETARSYGIKLVFTMADNWMTVDSKQNYNQWAGFDADSDQFWTNGAVKKLYKSHMRVMANRVNSFNGMRYKDDPTIFAWNLMNEPRCNCFPSELPYPANFSNLPPGCNPSCANNVTAWVGEMSKYLKSVDPHHLVTVGEEGFWGFNDSHIEYDPETDVSPWASLTGDNFTAQHAFSHIDYTAIHFWPDLWIPHNTTNTTFFYDWVGGHGNLSLLMHKPLVLEEMGTGVVANGSLAELQSNISTTRTPFMEEIYSHFELAYGGGGIWKGVLFWQWGFCPNNTQTNSLEVAASDSDFTSVIAPFSKSTIVHSIQQSPVAACKKVKPRKLPSQLAPSIASILVTPAQGPASTFYLSKNLDAPKINVTDAGPQLFYPGSGSPQGSDVVTTTVITTTVTSPAGGISVANSAPTSQTAQAPAGGPSTVQPAQTSNVPAQSIVQRSSVANAPSPKTPTTRPTSTPGHTNVAQLTSDGAGQNPSTTVVSQEGVQTPSIPTSVTQIVQTAG